MIPWYCKSFSKEDGRYYITAGEKSGLMVGQTLRIMTPGKLVKSPTGLPAGWIPGKEKGRLKVELFFGDDFSACSLVSGREPRAEDLIMAGGD
jgi:hypothetical protein